MEINHQILWRLYCRRRTAEVFVGSFGSGGCRRDIGLRTDGCICQSTFGSILGTVEDPSGAVIPDAVVRVKNLNDNSTQETRTNDQGEISF